MKQEFWDWLNDKPYRTRIFGTLAITTTFIWVPIVLVVAQWDEIAEMHVELFNIIKKGGGL